MSKQINTLPTDQYEQEKAEDQARWEQYLLTGQAIDGDKMERLLEALSQGKDLEWIRE